MSYVERTPQTAAEALEFTGKIAALRSDLATFYGETLNDSSGALSKISGFKTLLDRAYLLAAITPNLDDDATVSSLQEQVLYLLEQKINSSVGILPADKVPLIDFGFARIRFSRAVNSPKSEYAEPQKKAATQALIDLNIAAQNITDPTGKTEALTVSVSDQTTYDASGIEDIKPLLEYFNGHNLIPALAEVDATKFVLNKDDAKFTEIISELDGYAQLVSTKSGRLKLNPSQLDRIEDEILPQVMDLYKTYHGDNTALREANKLEQIVREILHEHRVTELGGSKDPKREFLRPSIVRDVPANMEGLIQMILGSHDAKITRAEVIGVKMAQVTSPNVTSDRATPDDRDFLSNFRDLLNVEDQRQLLQMESSMNVNDAGNKKYIDDFAVYMEKYLAWLDKLIVAATPAAPNPPGIPVAPGGAEVSRTKYDADIDGGVAGFLHDLITKSFPPTDRTSYLTAFERKEKELKKEGYADLADAIAFMRTIHEFRIFDASGGGSINIDHLTVRPEIALDALKSRDGLLFYDKLRSTAFFTKIIDKMTKAVYIKMLTPSTSTTPNSFYAGLDWNNGDALVELCFNDLYATDALFKAAVDAFPINLPGMDTFRQDVVNLIKRTTQYDASLRDLRTIAAAIALGLNKSAFKHADGQKVEPWGLPFQIGYKVGKNKDRGRYATALGWIKLPDIIFQGGTSPTDAEKREHKRNLTETIEEFEDYIETIFGHKAVHELNAKKWVVSAKYEDIPPTLAGFSTLNDFLTVPLAGGTRADNSNMDNFRKAEEATQEIYALASTCWATKLTFDSDPGEFRAQVNELLSKVGSTLAQAYATTTADSGRKRETLRSLTAAVNFYLVYLLSQIDRDPRQIIDNDYNRKYKIFVEEAVTYFESNGSMVVKFPGTEPVHSFRAEFEATIKSTAFRKKYVPSHMNREVIPFNLRRMRRAGVSNPQFAKSEDKQKHIEFPFKKPSDTSSKETKS